MKYRREIDGLRAIAVIPVILFHAGFETFSGGFVGVDIFFVISGYLITTIILSEMQNNRFSLANFYERRARRILPALFFVMILSLPFAWLWLVPSDHKSFSQSLISVSFFSSNIHFLNNANYFDSAAEMKPLLHTWSLAVEEQYYILFPLFLILVWHYRKRWIFGTIIVLGFISLLLAQWGAYNKPSATFYLLPTRAWELMAGASAAFFLLYGKNNNDIVNQNSVLSEVLSLFGLILIFISIFIYDQSIPFPSFYAFVPVFGVVLIILFSSHKTTVGKLLGSSLLVGIGLISYSLYLWHQPLFAFARHKNIQEPSQWVYFILILLTFAFAYINWRYVEKPFRNKSKFTRQKIFVFACIGSIIFVAIGSVGHYTNGFENRHLWYSNLLSYEYDNHKLQKQSWDILRKLSNDDSYGVTNNQYDENLWFDLKDKKIPLLLVGNSHSKDLFNILYNSKSANDMFQLARYGVQIRELADSSHKFYQSENYKKSKYVIIVTRFTSEDIKSLPLMLQRITEDRKKVYIIKRIFDFEYNPVNYKNLADYEIFKNCHNSSCDVINPNKLVKKINRHYFQNYINTKHEKHDLTLINNNIDIIAEEQGVGVLDRIDYVCTPENKECFAINDKLEKYFYDYGHHTLQGAAFFGQWIDRNNIWKTSLFNVRNTESRSRTSMSFY
jgi:peptidoglycan/LPS O-acetylase OafA/YrhL